MRKPDLTLALLRLCVTAARAPNGLPLPASELVEALSLDEAETDLLNNTLLQAARNDLIELATDSGGPGAVRFTITNVTERGRTAIESD